MEVYRSLLASNFFDFLHYTDEHLLASAHVSLVDSYYLLINCHNERTRSRDIPRYKTKSLLPQTIEAMKTDGERNSRFPAAQVFRTDPSTAWTA